MSCEGLKMISQKVFIKTTNFEFRDIIDDIIESVIKEENSYCKQLFLV